MGRLPSQQVMLQIQPGCPSGWQRVVSDGTNICFDLANYPGDVLVITDLSWTAATNAGATCALGIVSSTNGSGFFLISAAVAASDGFAAKSELTTGAILLSLKLKTMEAAPNYPARRYEFR